MFLVKHCVNWAVMKWASLLGPSLSLQHLFHNIVVISPWDKGLQSIHR